MRRRAFVLIVNLSLLATLLTGGTRAISAQGSLPGEPPSAEVGVLSGRAGVWRNYTNANYVTAVAVHGDNVWAGTDGGLVHWDLSDGSYAKFVAPDGFPDDQVTAVVVDSAGCLWLGAGTWLGGVAVYDGAAWTSFSGVEGLANNFVTDMVIDSEGRKWVGTARGVSVFSDNNTPHDKTDDAWTSYKKADGLADDDVRAIVIDGAEYKWFGIWRGGVSVLNDGGTPHEKGDDTWTSFTTADGLASNAITAAAVDKADLKWFGNWDSGASVLDDGGTPHNKSDDTWTTFATVDGLASDPVCAVAVDGAGLKWFSGYGGGVSVLDDGGTPHIKSDDTWTTFSVADGLAGDWIEGMAVGAADDMWFATYGAGVSHLDHGGTWDDRGDDVWMSYVTDDWLLHNDVEAVATEGPDLAWIGTHGGLVAFDGSDWTAFSTARVVSIVPDGAGDKWIGTSDGVMVLSDGGTPHDETDDSWTAFSTTDGLVRGPITGLDIGEAGLKWFGSGRGGVSVLDDNATPHDKGDDTWTSFSTDDGLSGGCVHALAVDGPNLVWFAHEGKGVSMLDHGRTPHDKADDVWTTFTEADGLAGSAVYSVAIDAVGLKWFGACTGICVLDDRGTPHVKSDDLWTEFSSGDCHPGLAIDALGRKWIAAGWSGVEVLDDGGTPHDQGDDVWCTYTVSEGLVDNRTQAIALSPGGTVWVCTDGGLSVFEPLPYCVFLPVMLRSD